MTTLANEWIWLQRTLAVGIVLLLITAMWNKGQHVSDWVFALAFLSLWVTITIVRLTIWTIRIVWGLLRRLEAIAAARNSYQSADAFAWRTSAKAIEERARFPL